MEFNQSLDERLKDFNELTDGNYDNVFKEVDLAQSPIPNPQSPIPNPHIYTI